MADRQFVQGSDDLDYQSNSSCCACDIDIGSVAEQNLTTTRKKIRASDRAEQRHLTVQIRNARERSRIYEINQAFARLRQAIPYTVGRTKRISKVKTLEKALQYITELETQLEFVFV